MEILTIGVAAGTDYEWAARLMAGSDPWITLGRSFDICLRACSDPACILYMARLDDQPCGFLLLHPKGVAGSPYVRSIATAPEFRSCGIGSALLNHVEGAHAPESRFLFLCVSSFNARARELYERQGFSVVGELKDYIVEGLSEILMIKKLVRQ
jgi:[ribosomal protein S18]-alanine N-acetyltransferase